MTQVLTGYDAFEEFLLRIRREVTSTCHHCEKEEDTAQHTLEFCPAWEELRRVLRLAIGERLALEAIVEAMLREQQKYIAVRSYCEQVMFAKERAEKERTLFNMEQRKCLKNPPKEHQMENTIVKQESSRRRHGARPSYHLFSI
ncbi:uncharacterized protein LOC105681603 [Bombus impatiens]|uniref:Uncharacterized protein LOC105681603 n=1 Tax=Bombus impatiens TaxID=132113 RepID=A0A6P3V4D5_BOMIM|nr:uncharacterized protein LOC105681603 [Bombus impatiens]